jgi:hypothetical protein
VSAETNEIESMYKMNFFNIEFKKICRDCLNTDGMTNVFSIMGNEVPYLKYSEWELSERMFIESKKRYVCCENCGSSNFQMYNTKVNLFNEIHYSYDFQREGYNRDFAFFYMISLTKTNGFFTFEEGGRNNTASIDKIDFIKFLQKALQRESSSSFKSYRKGDFIFVVSGKFNNIEDDYNIYFRIEKFYHTGFSKEEILKLLNENSSAFQIDGF